MDHVRFSPKAFIIFISFLLAFAGLLLMDVSSGVIRRIWPILVLALVVGGTVAICHRMWQARDNSADLRRAEAQGLYGVLPKKLREWLFP
jgi:hypothetical protein